MFNLGSINAASRGLASADQEMSGKRTAPHDVRSGRMDDVERFVSANADWLSLTPRNRAAALAWSNREATMYIDELQLEPRPVRISVLGGASPRQLCICRFATCQSILVCLGMLTAVVAIGT
jgi:hypothetical protein